MRAARATSSLTLLLLASVPALSSQSARDVLLRSMEVGRKVSLTAIIEQLEGPNKIQLKVEQQKSGYTRVTVLQPLRYQGVSSIDDGRRWVTYVPDERRLMIQESPRRHIANPRSRIALTVRNYSLKLDDREEVAGRSADVVVAIPRAPEMPTRRYYIDRETGFLLRLELIEEGSLRVAQDTMSVTFENSKDDKPFELRLSGSVRQIHMKPPVPVRSLSTAKKELGFAPVIPRRLPFGYSLSSMQITSEKGKALAVRITDGLQSSTVYQWWAKAEEQPWPFMEAAGDVEFGGIRLRVIGDLPKSVNFKLLQSFVSALRTSKRVEPSTSGAALESPYRVPISQPAKLPSRAGKRTGKEEEYAD